MSAPSSDGARQEFPETSRTLHQRIQSNSPTESSEALNEFFNRYWVPLYGFLRSSGESHESASDYLQEFITTEILGRDQLSTWDPGKGRLRSFLKTCLDRHRKKQIRHGMAQKRGGNRAETHVSIDYEWADSYFVDSSSSGESPDQKFDREWASAIVGNATSLLAESFGPERKKEFGLFLRNLEDRGEKENSASYERISLELGISVDAVKQRMKTFRVKFQQCLRRVVADFVSEDEVEDEIDFLLGALGKS